MKPEIDFKHVLSELSINRKDACEVIRELISNSYDADARNIYYFPLLENEGFIFFDDGIGLDKQHEIKGITPYKAFFSIGRSTKTEGDGIGYKCQGSKLCFASTTFALITKTKDDLKWSCMTIENPRRNLETNTDITPFQSDEPWMSLRDNLLNPNNQSESILNFLNKDFFSRHSSGTLLLVLGFEASEFAKYFATDNLEKSYLYNYIRFHTKHGDVRIIKSEHGFEADKVKSLNKIDDIKHDVTFHAWDAKCNSLKEIPSGFPYLAKEEHEQKLPNECAQLKDGRFYARHAKHLTINGRNYSFILTIDGYRRALEKYSALGRQRNPESGIRLTDQRGVVICSKGIKICSYNELFSEAELDDFAVLQDAKSQLHYSFFIDGPFTLVTNRNSLSDKSLSSIKDNSFLNAVRQFLAECRDKKTSLVFKQLVGRLNKENQELELEKQSKLQEKQKKGIILRDRFDFQNSEFASKIFGTKSFVVPEIGEEHYVGALYIMLGNIVSSDNQYADLWIRPLTFSARGIDSIGSVGSTSNFAENNLRAIEYKMIFDINERFNHPLNITDYIVAWQIKPPVSENHTVVDDFQLSGLVERYKEYPLTLASKIVNIRSTTDELYTNSIITINLKELIRLTFNVVYRTQN